MSPRSPKALGPTSQVLYSPPIAKQQYHVDVNICFVAKGTQGSSQATLAAPARGPRTPRKVSAQVTKLEAVDDTSDPLGPLGGDSFPSAIPEQGPTPPLKEPSAVRNVRPTSSTSQSSGVPGIVESAGFDEEAGAHSRVKGPPPVQPPSSSDGAKRQAQPSMTVEKAAKPSFYITVGDPHKVGDLTSSHIVYQVRTKVWSSYEDGTCCTHYKRIRI